MPIQFREERGELGADEAGRGGDGATEILCGRMGLRGDVSKIGVLSERRKEYWRVHQQTRTRWEFADQYVHSQGPVGDFEGLLVNDLGRQGKAYKAYVFGNEFPGALVETGAFEGDALVYRSEFPVEGANLKLRNVTRVTGPGTLVSEEFMAMKDAPETLLVRVEAKKRLIHSFSLGPKNSLFDG